MNSEQQAKKIIKRQNKTIKKSHKDKIVSDFRGKREKKNVQIEKIRKIRMKTHEERARQVKSLFN